MAAKGTIIILSPRFNRNLATFYLFFCDTGAYSPCSRYVVVMPFRVNGEKKNETKEESIILSKVCACVCVRVHNYGRLLLPDQNQKNHISIRLWLEKLIVMKWRFNKIFRPLIQTTHIIRRHFSGYSNMLFVLLRVTCHDITCNNKMLQITNVIIDTGENIHENILLKREHIYL